MPRLATARNNPISCLTLLDCRKQHYIGRRNVTLSANPSDPRSNRPATPGETAPQGISPAVSVVAPAPVTAGHHGGSVDERSPRTQRATRQRRLSRKNGDGNEQ